MKLPHSRARTLDTKAVKPTFVRELALCTAMVPSLCGVAMAAPIEAPPADATAQEPGGAETVGAQSEPALPAAGEPVTEAQAAAPAEANIIEEIIITTSRQRSESVQSAPVAVSVITPAVLEALNAKDITGLSAVVPNLNVAESAAVVGLASVSLRGFSSRASDISAEPAVAIYVDGVYQTVQPGALFDLFDLQSVEVLRGPQGTLLGKNAPAGALLLTRSRPTGEFSLRTKVDYGSYNLRQAQALMNFPLFGETLSGKLYANVRKRDPYIDNIAFPDHDLGGEDRSTLRGAVLYEPLDNLSFYLSTEYSRDRSDNAPGRSDSGQNTATCAVFTYCNTDADKRRVTRADFFEPNSQDDYSTTLTADWKFGQVALKSISGYRDYSSVNNADLDGTDQPILHAFDNHTDVDSFSQEIRLNSVSGGGLDFDGRLDWVIGAYYNHSKGRQNQALYAFGGASSVNQTQRVERTGQAAFAHAQFSVTEPWNVSFGIRNGKDKTEHAFSLPVSSSYPKPDVDPDPDHFESAKFNNTSIEAGTQYRFNTKQMVFFRYSEGYRGGGFTGYPTSDAARFQFSPEESTSYEVGMKSDWLQDTLRVNLTVFSVEFDNLQRDVVQASETGLSQVIANATATTRGVELETIIAPTRAFTLRINLGYLDAEYDSFQVPLGNGEFADASGQQIAYAPKYTGFFGADYHIDLTSLSFARIETGVFNFGIDMRSELQTSGTGAAVGFQDGYSSVNGSFTVHGADDLYALSFYVNNLFDQDWKVLGESVPGLLDFANDNLGRTIGVSLQFTFK